MAFPKSRIATTDACEVGSQPVNNMTYVPSNELAKFRDDLAETCNKVIKIETRLDGMPKRSTWIDFASLIAVLIAVGGSALTLNNRITKVSDSVRVLANQQSDQTQKLIRDLLAVVNKTDSAPTAAKAFGCCHATDRFASQCETAGAGGVFSVNNSEC
jgi:hypothetical protein